MSQFTLLTLIAVVDFTVIFHVIIVLNNLIVNICIVVGLLVQEENEFKYVFYLAGK